MGMASTVFAFATVGKCRETVRTGALLPLAVAVILSTFTVCRRSSRPSNAAQTLHLVYPSFDEGVQLVRVCGHVFTQLAAYPLRLSHHGVSSGHWPLQR